MEPECVESFGQGGNPSIRFSCTIDGENRRLIIDSSQEMEHPIEASQALVRYIRENPDALRRPAESLAAEFKLSPEFVRRMLLGLEPEAEDRPSERRPAALSLASAARPIRAAFFRATENPIGFVSTTAVVSIAGALTLDHLAGPSHVREGEGRLFSLGADSPGFAWFAGVTFALHMACYFRHARVRHALLGGLVCWLISAATAMTMAWFRTQSAPEVDTVFLLLMIAFGMFTMSVAYAGLGSIAAVLGGVYRLRRKDRELEMMSRQDLLQRLFELQDRMTRAKQPAEHVREKAWRLLSARIRSRPWLYAIEFGFVMNLALVLVRAGMVGHWTEEQIRTAPIVLMILFTIQFGEIVGMAVVAFFSRNVWLAICHALLLQASSLPPLLLPVRHFGVQNAPIYLSVPSLAVMAGLAVIVGAAAYAGSKVEARAAREHSLRHDDPAALLAEMVRIQWKLKVQSSDVCVLVVDVARSSEMKAGADPLKAEFSFREFQVFTEESCAQFGGRVHSTAGDGAVVAFGCGDRALAAATRLQSGLAKFNIERNRLDTPFRVRIGIHKGAIAGELDKIVFTEVIDIAAHVQARAPVGGIAVSETILGEVPDEPVAPLKDQVDGYTVYFVLDPTEDA